MRHSFPSLSKTPSATRGWVCKFDDVVLNIPSQVGVHWTDTLVRCVIRLGLLPLGLKGRHQDIPGVQSKVVSNDSFCYEIIFFQSTLLYEYPLGYCENKESIEKIIDLKFLNDIPQLTRTICVWTDVIIVDFSTKNYTNPKTLYDNL